MKCAFGLRVVAGSLLQLTGLRCAIANLTRIENFATRPQCCVTIAFDDADVRLLPDSCTYCAFLSKI